jgi:serine/threonine protein kinase
MREYAVGDEPVPGYQITRPLGAGGYGTVWVAKSPGDVEIALKIINLQGQGLKEFRAISLVKRLRHPNLIPIYAFWLKDEYGNFLDSTAQDSVNLRGRSSDLIIAMGLGEMSLTQRLEQCKTEFAQRHNLPDNEGSLIAKLQALGGSELAGIPVEELLEYMLGSAKAIDYLNQPTHNLGAGPTAAIQHCDIKPGNLLVVGNDVQVCDYGLARALTSDARKTQAAGTPAYMAPELIAGKPSSGTDQYSLAITYYELRTGKLPFDESLAFHAHITGQFDYGLLGAGEQEILRRATQARPDQRFAHTMEMVRALRETITPTKSHTPFSTSLPPSGSPPSSSPPPQQQPASSTGPSGVFRGGGSGGTSGSGVAATSEMTITTKPTVLDDLIRAGIELVPGHKLEQMLGRGGYGEVWSAKMPGNTKCALKIVRNLDAMQGKQELKSLDLIRDLDHDRLIRLQAYWLLAYDGSVIPDEQIGQPGTPKTSGLVIATDLAAKNLLQRWQECYDQGNAGIPVPELVPYIRQSAEAIDHLNFQEPAIVHRDIKPENILLTKHNQVKVSDFGLAKIVEGTGVISAASVGMTLAYAAPEMFKNTVSRATDQYSLAVTYYRLRVGRLPFEDGLGPIQMMQAHADGRLEFNGIAEAEQAVLRRACTVDPQGRFGSCMEFADALGTAVGLSHPTMVSSPAIHHPSAPAVTPPSSRWPTDPAATPAVPPGAIRATAVFTPSPSDTPAGIRETQRFEDVKAPPIDPRVVTAPLGWPQARPPVRSSSDEFQLPPETARSATAPRHASMPAGITETTANIPAFAQRDTDREPQPSDWKKKPPRAAGGGSAGKMVGIAVGVAVLIAGIGSGIYWGMSGKTPPSSKESAAVPINNDKTDKKKERIEKLQADAARTVTDQISKNEFAAAAQAVRDAEGQKADAEWVAKQNGRVLTAWRAVAKTAVTPRAQLDEMRRISDTYPDDADTKADMARITQELAAQDPKTLEPMATAALAAAMDRLKAGDYPAAIAKLDAVKSVGLPTSHQLVVRAADLREPLGQLAAAAKAAPSDDLVAKLATDIRNLPPVSDADAQKALQAAYRTVLAGKIAGIAPTLGDKSDWDQLLTASRLALPGASDPTAAWVAGCAAESAAELLAVRANPADESLIEVEAALAARALDDPTDGYLTYAQARLAWERKKDRAAAGRMLVAYPDSGEPAAALKSPRRMAGAAGVLAAAANQLRQSDPTHPFKPADAAQAMKWLKAAARLSKASPAPAQKLNLALAAWVAGDKSTAKTAVEAFVTPETRKGLAPKDVAAILNIRAATQDEATEAGRIARIESLAALVGLYQSNPKDVTAEMINLAVVQPLALAGPAATGATAKARARLLADVAKAIQADPATWAKLLGKTDPWPKIRELYEEAERLDSQAEYIVHKAFASMQGAAKGQPLPVADLLADADRAIAKNKDYAGSHTLRGRLLHQRAVRETDRMKQIADLREAVKEFAEADKLGGTAAPVEDVRWLYQSWSGACLLLGNFTTDAEEKQKSIRGALQYAEKITERDAKYFEGQMALGNASEDVAYFLGDTDYFSQAIRAFDEAKKLAFLPGEGRPWVAGGRTQYRRAEKFQATSADKRAEADQWLQLAETDLTTAVAKLSENATASGPVLAAEAQYFLGLTYALRADYARAGNKSAAADTEATKAEKAYAAAFALAQSNPKTAGQEWGRLIGVARCGLAMKLAQAYLSKDRLRAREYLKQTRALAGQLREFSPVSAALWEGAALDVEAGLMNPYNPEAGSEIVKVLKTGLTGGTAAEKTDQYEIGRRLAGWYSGNRLPGGRPDYDAAFDAMDAAARAAREGGFDAEMQAQALSDASECRRKALLLVEAKTAPLKPEDIARKDKYLEDFVDRNRRAVEMAPDHRLAWWWKLQVASDGGTRRILALRRAEPDKSKERTVKEARILEETARFYRESDNEMPFSMRPSFPWLDEQRKLIDKELKVVLDKAITETPADKDVWKWQWALAEAYARDDGSQSLAEARKRLAAAEASIPKTAPESANERVRQLRKELDARK